MRNFFRTLILGPFLLCVSAVAAAPSPTHHFPSSSAAPLRTARKVVLGPKHVGKASWYGPTGQLCADGKPYRIHKMFVASRTLAFGTMLRITNPATGRTIEAPVRDRGPHVPGRVLDLSVAAATALGTKRRGVALVTYYVIERHA